jgi:hypothetical protein
MAANTPASREWVQFDPFTETYVTGDGTRVASELADNVQCLVDVLHVAGIREAQRAEMRKAKEMQHGS